MYNDELKTYENDYFFQDNVKDETKYNPFLYKVRGGKYYVIFNGSKYQLNWKLQNKYDSESKCLKPEWTGDNEHIKFDLLKEAVQEIENVIIPYILKWKPGYEELIKGWRVKNASNNS